MRPLSKCVAWQAQQMQAHSTAGPVDSDGHEQGAVQYTTVVQDNVRVRVRRDCFASDSTNN